MAYKVSDLLAIPPKKTSLRGLTPENICDIIEFRTQQPAELAELVDALDSGSSVCKDFRVQVPGSAF